MTAPSNILDVIQRDQSATYHTLKVAKYLGINAEHVLLKKFVREIFKKYQVDSHLPHDEEVDLLLSLHPQRVGEASLNQLSNFEFQNVKKKLQLIPPKELNG